MPSFIVKINIELMKKNIKIFFICLYLFFAASASSQVSQGNYSCIFIDGNGAVTDKGFYLQILPENLSMIDRNSKLREKNLGTAEIIAFNTWNAGAVSAELLYSFDVKVIKNKYYENTDSAKFPHKFLMDRKTYALKIKNIYTKETLNYQCKELNKGMSFEDLILERIVELQELIDLK